MESDLMARMSYLQIRQALADFSAERAVGGQPFETAVLWDDKESWAGTWSNEDMFVIVGAAWFPHEPGRTFVDIHAGGAYGLTASEELFESLCHASLRLDGGAPWTRRQPDGS